VRARLLFWVVGIALGLIGATAIARAQGPSASVTIVMTEYKFEPATVRLRAGSTVVLRLVNRGILAHELLIGRGVAKSPKGAPDHYGQDFFQGIRVELLSAQGIEELAAGKAQLAGPLAQKFLKKEAGEEVFEIALKPKGQAVLRFSVPAARVGTWEMGCFEQEGAHYLAGMKGTLIVGR
jgi:plastocyanin